MAVTAHIGGSRFEFVLRDWDAIAGALTTFNFVDLDSGPVRANRLVVLGVAGISGVARTVSAVDVNGNVADLRVVAFPTPTFRNPSAIATILNPSSKLIDVDVTFNAAMTGAVCFVGTLTRYLSQVPADFGSNGNTTFPNSAYANDVPAEGINVSMLATLNNTIPIFSAPVTAQQSLSVPTQTGTFALAWYVNPGVALTDQFFAATFASGGWTTCGCSWAPK